MDSPTFNTTRTMLSKRSEVSQVFFRDPDLNLDIDHQNFLLKICDARYEDVIEYRNIKKLIKKNNIEHETLLER